MLIGITAFRVGILGPVKTFRIRSSVVLAAALLMCAGLAAEAEAPKRGGTLTYMIAADGGPSLDGHRETTFAVLHATAPFYSVLIRVNPDNPSSTTEFMCDLCTEMPKPADNGLTYTFKIRKGLKFHDGRLSEHAGNLKQSKKSNSGESKTCHVAASAKAPDARRAHKIGGPAPRRSSSPRRKRSENCGKLLASSPMML